MPDCEEKTLFFPDYVVSSSSHQLPPGTIDNYESIYETIRHPAHERGGGGGLGRLGLQHVDNEDEDFDSESDFDEIDEEETDESSEINSNSAKRRHHSRHHHPHFTNAGKISLVIPR